MNILKINKVINDRRATLVLRRRPGSPQGMSGSVFYVIRNHNASKRGKGVDSNFRFNFDATPSSCSNRLRGKCDAFSIQLDFALSPEQEGPMMEMRAEGDFEEILSYVFNQVPNKLKIDLEVEFRLNGSDSMTAVVCELTGKKAKDGDMIFSTDRMMTEEFARKLRQTITLENKVDVTLDLSGWDTPPSGSDTALPISTMDERILGDVENTKDFVFIATNSSRFGCHELFLRATNSDFFLSMLNRWINEGAKRECKLTCTEKATRIFRDFLYVGSLSEVEEDVGVVFELLEEAHVTGYADLENALKNLILRKDEQWLTVGEALFLFDKALKWGPGYEDLEKHAVKTINGNLEELSTSPEFITLFGQDPESTRRLMCACLSATNPAQFKRKSVVEVEAEEEKADEDDEDDSLEEDPVTASDSE